MESRGERFRFYYDLEAPEVLHITLRHGTTPTDAIRVFYDGVTQAWDELYQRFVTTTRTHGIYWTRHPHDQSVLIISCFERHGINALATLVAQ